MKKTYLFYDPKMDADGPPLDFPAERVWDLLEELCRILFDYLRVTCKIALKSLGNHRRILTLWLLDWWSTTRELVGELMELLLSHVPTKRDLPALSRLLEDAVLSFRCLPLLIQIFITCFSVYVTQRCISFLRQRMRIYNKYLARRLYKKTGRSEIKQGRTSLVYGATGDLMDEEYLEDINPGMENARGGRGRFGTFDFFGINTTTNENRTRKFRNRKRSYSSDDDIPLGYTSRQRTKSMESLGNPSGAALVRSRNDSMESLSDTMGGFFQAFKSFRENGASSKRSNEKKALTRSSFEMEEDETRIVSTQITIEKKSRRFRKERLGSMDIYYKPGKKQSPLAASGGRFKSSSWGDESASDSEGANYFENFGDEEMRYLHDEFGIVTLSHKVEYHGPFQPVLNCGSTFVPPPPFEVVSRKIGSSEIDLPLKRIIKMNLLQGSLNVIEPTTSDSMNQKYDMRYDDLDEISIKFKEPLEGGVFFLYKKGTKEHGPDWKEHSFESTHAAAQFQLDLLAYQALGKPLRHIFEALHLVHQGSLSCEGQEFVMHDNIRDDGNSRKNGEKDENKSNNKENAAHCVAWDDAMRAMGSIPTVRIALERLWLSHNRPSAIGNKNTKSDKEKSKIAIENEKITSAELSLLKDEYIKNRLLLGPVDFYRLFVPSLPETAIPEGDFTNRGRMEQLLCWRKRVARASILVKSFTRARLVANRGWNLDRAFPPPGTSAVGCTMTTGVLGDHGGEQITKRFAYDGNENNHLRDISSKNEIYEASVSRDVLCHVRPFDYLNQNENEEIVEKTQQEDGSHPQKHFVLSPYQAYTYIESHYFKATKEMLDEDGLLHPSRDPVEMFPSLKDVIIRHPDLDFFVDCLSNPEDKILIVHLHVRSLAKGIDPQFDNVIDRFSNADEESRKRKLYLMVQVGNKIGFSFLGWLFLKLLSLYFRFTETCRDSPMNLESTRDRYGFPGFRVGGLFRTYHFGGSLQTDPDMPNNYIGLTKSTASYYESILGKIVLDHLQRHFFESTVDLTFVIEGERNDELPERALSSLRIVHVNPNKVSIDPRPYLAIFKESNIKHVRSTSFSTVTLQDAVQYSLDSVRSIVHSGLPLLSPKKNKQTIMTESPLRVISEDESDVIDAAGATHLIRKVGRIDPLERGIDLTIDILRSVTVLCRQQREEEKEETDLRMMSRIPVLTMFNRSDIGRYIANCGYDLRIASERLVETASWRGETFPIDKRRCRIELQNGQFFQQGVDKENNPVFYFRNLCRGPWRGDSKAIILAILCRLDKSLVELCKTNPDIKVTLIVLMGHAKRGARKKMKLRGSDSSNSENDSDFDIDDFSDSEKKSPKNLLEIPSEEEIKVNSGNPRISPDEKWTCHTNKELLRNLVEIMISHYPGRLARILVVKGRGRNHYYRDQVEGKMELRKLLSGLDKKTYRKLLSKVQFVHKTTEVTKHIALKDLPTFVGGISPINDAAYEF